MAIEPLVRFDEISIKHFQFECHNFFLLFQAGFLGKQNEIAAGVFRPYYYIPDVVDPPYETPRKTYFIKKRPIKSEFQN